MTKISAYLVKPSINTWERFRAHLTHDYEALDQDHQLYVPETFVLGHFKRRKIESSNRFQLSHNIDYWESSRVLAEYKNLMKGGNLDIVQSLLLSQEILDSIALRGKAYIDVRTDITQIFQSIGGFFR